MSTIDALASSTGLPAGNRSLIPPDLNSDIAESSSSSLSFSEESAEISLEHAELFGSSRASPLQAMRIDSLQAGFRSVELMANSSSFQDGILETASLIYRQASLNINISSTALVSFAEDASELEALDPELLQDYLALIKLLDEQTPDSLDPFFNKLRNILKGNPDTEVLQKASDSLDINVPIDASATTSEQVQEFFINVEISVTELTVKVERQVQKADPLILDLDGDGIELDDYQQGKLFDINSDGQVDKTAFVAGDDAFLALDRNQNGRIDNGSELFGDQHGAADGFQELSLFDENGDQKITADDSIYHQLLLFDGSSTSSLDQAGIVAINTLMTTTPGMSIEANSQLGYSSFQRADGSTGQVSDMLLNFVS